MKGFIYSWSLLGFGFVLVNNKDLYFLHVSDIQQGKDLVAKWQTVSFDTAPPLPGKKYPRAINAVVGGAQ